MVGADGPWQRGAMVPAELLDGVVERSTLAEHPGMSGAALERVRLADGRRLVVKRITPASDLTLRLMGGEVAWELRLWRSGTFDRLPAGVATAVVDGWVDPDGTSVIVMRDLGGAVPRWGDRLDTSGCRQLVRGLVALHAAYADDPPAEVAPLEPSLGGFAPSRMAPAAAEGSRFAGAVLRGWEHLHAVVPADVAAAVLALAEDPGRLADALRARPVTFVHGDVALTNLALKARRVVLLDWAMPAAAPGALDWARFVAGCAASVEPDRDGLLALYGEAAGASYDDVAMQLALLSGLVWLGWNKAHDVVEGRDPVVRTRERADLEWWVRRASRTLESVLT